ncbi:MAG: acetyltransferase [Leptospirales bacterium]|nr:acetyltransferase [Leptospirales bacterium]
MQRLKLLLALLAFGGTMSLQAAADKSTYPVVFAHGMGGFNNLLGFDYFGDDYGNFVGDPCDEFLEVTCNSNLNSGQKTFIGQVAAFQTSEVRGVDLANDIEGYMATVGATRINIIGHSQGGLDARKAAYVLKQRKGTAIVRVLMTVSTPHRGSPVAKYVMDLGPGITSVVSALASMFGNAIYQPGNDGHAALKQLIHKDYSSTDGVTTGTQNFNALYPNSSSIAYRYVSVITAQAGVNVNPALFVVKTLKNIDGNGYCVGDCDNDGAEGQGNGTATDLDDDGLVGINSQQNGWRLQYNSCFLCLDSFTTITSLGEAPANSPSSAQMTSTLGIVEQDHADVVGVPPDTFDEMEFYAAAIHYIAIYD